jgi:hypothetical protein
VVTVLEVTLCAVDVRVTDLLAAIALVCAVAVPAVRAVARCAAVWCALETCDSVLDLE